MKFSVNNLKSICNEKILVLTELLKNSEEENQKLIIERMNKRENMFSLIKEKNLVQLFNQQYRKENPVKKFFFFKAIDTRPDAVAIEEDNGHMQFSYGVDSVRISKSFTRKFLPDHDVCYSSGIIDIIDTQRIKDDIDRFNMMLNLLGSLYDPHISKKQFSKIAFNFNLYFNIFFQEYRICYVKYNILNN